MCLFLEEGKYLHFFSIAGKLLEKNAEVSIRKIEDLYSSISFVANLFLSLYIKVSDIQQVNNNKYVSQSRQMEKQRRK